MHATHKVGFKKKNQIIFLILLLLLLEHKFFNVSIGKMQIELAVFKFEFF